MSSHSMIWRPLLALLLVSGLTQTVWAEDASPATDTPDAVTEPASEPAPEALPEPAAEPEAPKRSNVPPAKRETDGGKLFIVAYIVIWLLPLYLLFMTSRRVRRLEDELETLRRLIDSRDEDA